MKNTLWKVCIGIVSFLQAVIFVIMCAMFSTVKGFGEIILLLIMSFIALGILSLLDKVLRKEKDWMSVIWTILLSPIRFIAQIIAFIVASKKNLTMERGKYDDTNNWYKFVYLLTTIDIAPKKKKTSTYSSSSSSQSHPSSPAKKPVADLAPAVVTQAMLEIARYGNDAIHYPSGPVLRIHTEFKLEGHKLHFTIVGQHEHFELFKSDSELKAKRATVDATVERISNSLSNKAEKWYQDQNCIASYELSVDYVERK